MHHYHHHDTMDVMCWSEHKSRQHSSSPSSQHHENAPTIKNHSVSYFHGHLYCFGGYDGRRNHMTLLLYSIRDQRWIRPHHIDGNSNTGHHHPHQLHRHLQSGGDGIGGIDNTNSSMLTDTSIIVTGTKPPARNGHSATLATDPDDDENGRIIIIGGWLGTGPLAASDMHVLDISQGGRQLRWYQPAVKGTPPGPCNMHSADFVESRREVYVFRGGNGREYLNDLHALHVDTYSWRRVETTGAIPQQRANHSSAILEETGELFIFGGWNGTERLNDIHILDTATSNWTCPHVGGVLPHPRAGMTLTALRGRLFLFGGSGTSSKCFQDLQILDRNQMAWLDVTQNDGTTNNNHCGNNNNNSIMSHRHGQQQQQHWWEQDLHDGGDDFSQRWTFGGADYERPDAVPSNRQHAVVLDHHFHHHHHHHHHHPAAAGAGAGADHQDVSSSSSRVRYSFSPMDRAPLPKLVLLPQQQQQHQPPPQQQQVPQPPLTPPQQQIQQEAQPQSVSPMDFSSQRDDDDGSTSPGGGRVGFTTIRADWRSRDLAIRSNSLRSSGVAASPNPNDEDTIPTVVVHGQGPGRRAGHTATAVNRKIYVFGGSCGSEYLNDFFMLDTDPISHARVTEPTSLHLLARRLRHFFNDEEFSDVTFVVQGRKVYGHKMVLSIVSDCFRAMFTAGFRESEALEIPISDCSYSAFLAVMEYIYTGQTPKLDLLMSNNAMTTISSSSSSSVSSGGGGNGGMSRDVVDLSWVVEILELSDRFFLDHLKQICETILEPAVNAETVDYMIQVAQKTNACQLQAVCEHFLRNRDAL